MRTNDRHKSRHHLGTVALLPASNTSRAQELLSHSVEAALRCLRVASTSRRVHVFVLGPKQVQFVEQN